MALRYCPHCEQMVTARRQFGIGTLLLVLVTGGLWLLVLGCYLPRCPLCKSHFLGKDTAPDAPGGRRRPVPPAPTDYEGRLDALVHTRDHEKHWRRWGLWGLGAALSVPMVIGLVRLLPIQQKPLPPAPVPALTLEGRQRPESSASVETPEPVRSSSDFVVLPGKLVGNFSLGMTREAILKIAPKPQEAFPDRLVYISRKTGNSLVMHMQNNKTVQIDFTSKDFYTGEGIHTGNFWDEQYAPLFNVWVLPGTFPSYKFTLKTDGLTFYSLNVGSSSPNYPKQVVGAIHIGQQPLYEVQKIAGQENGRWVPWDKGLASTKQPAKVKTPRPPMQPLPGALPWPGEQAEQQAPRGGTPTPKTAPVQPLQGTRCDEYTAIVVVVQEVRDKGWPPERAFQEVQRLNATLNDPMGTSAKEWVEIITYVYQHPTKYEYGLLDWAWEACKQPVPTPPR
jgi:hypothetical protein